MGSRWFFKTRRLLPLAGIILALLVMIQGPDNVAAQGGSYGWQLGTQFFGDTAGFQGSDPGLELVCPPGHIVVGGAIDWGWNGLVRTVTGIKLGCRKVNELGANPDWLNSFYDWAAPTVFVPWGSTGYNVGSYGAPNTLVEGFWVLTRVWQGTQPKKLSPWVNYHRSYFEFSGQLEAVQWSDSADGLFAGSVASSNLAPSNNDTGSCGGTAFFNSDYSLNDSPYTSLQAVRGLRIYLYTPAFSTQQRVGGFTVMCQDLNRVEFTASTGPTPQQSAKGLGVSIAEGQTAVVSAGQTFDYTISVLNSSIEEATGVALSVTLHDGATFVSAVSSRGECSQSGVLVSCPLGSMLGGSGASVVITLTAADAGAVITDTVSLTAASGQIMADQSSAHMSTIVYGSQTPVPGDLNVNVAEEADPADPDGPSTYTVTVSNQGPQPISGVSLVDPQPDGADLVSLSSTQGSCAVIGGAAVCSLGVLEAGSNVIVTVGTTPSVSGTISDDVTVAGSTAGGDQWVATLAGSSVLVVEDETSYGWERAGQFTGELVGFKGTDSGVDVACPDGYLLMGGGVADDKVGLVLTTRGVALTCRKINELRANPYWLTSFYDMDAPTATASWGTTKNGSQIPVVSYGSPEMIVEGFWVKTRAGIEPPMLKPSIQYHFSYYEFSGESVDVEFDTSVQGMFYGIGAHKPYKLDFGGCGGAGFLDVTGSMNDTPYTTLNGVRGLHIYRYTPAFSNEQMIGGFSLLCQTIQRVEIPSPTAGATPQSDPQGLGISTPDGNIIVASGGQTFSYKVDVNNDSLSDATGVTLAVKLDDGVSLVSASSSRGECSQSGSDVTCSVGSMSAGESVPVFITMSAPASGTAAAISSTLSSVTGELSAAGGVVDLTATVYGSADPVPGGLSVVVSDGADPVDPGASLTYTVTVSNQGTESIGYVSLFDPLPAEVELVSLSASQGSCAKVATTVYCPLGVLEAGAIAVVDIGVAAPMTLGIIPNDVTVTGAPADGTQWEVTASETTTVATLSSERSISGTVRDAEGNPMAGIPVVVFTTTGGLSLVAEATSDASGHYTIEDLVPSVYFVLASPPQTITAANFVDQWYSQKQGVPEADQVDLNVLDATGVDFHLRQRLSQHAYFGTVTEVSGSSFSTFTNSGIVGAVVESNSVQEGGETLATGRRVAVVTDNPAWTGENQPDSGLVTATSIFIIPTEPKRTHVRGVVAEKAVDGKTTVVVEEGKTLQVPEAHSKNLSDGAHVVLVVNSAGPSKEQEVVGSVHSTEIEDRLDGFLGEAEKSGIVDAASHLESLKSDHADGVQASTGRSQEHADEDIKDTLDAAISSHAEAGRTGEGTKGDRTGEGTKDGGADHGESSRDDGGSGSSGDDRGGDDGAVEVVAMMAATMMAVAATTTVATTGNDSER